MAGLWSVWFVQFFDQRAASWAESEVRGGLDVLEVIFMDRSFLGRLSGSGAQPREIF